MPRKGPDWRDGCLSFAWTSVGFTVAVFALAMSAVTTWAVVGPAARRAGMCVTGCAIAAFVAGGNTLAGVVVRLLLVVGWGAPVAVFACRIATALGPSSPAAFVVASAAAALGELLQRRGRPAVGE